MRFKIDWASLIVGSKFTVFALFYFVFEGNFSSTNPRGAYIWRGDFIITEGFLRYRIGGLIHGVAYFRNFTVSPYDCAIVITVLLSYTIYVSVTCMGWRCARNSQFFTDKLGNIVISVKIVSKSLLKFFF